MSSIRNASPFGYRDEFHHLLNLRQHVCPFLDVLVVNIKRAESTTDWRVIGCE
jgi:hypothetical protein